MTFARRGHRIAGTWLRDWEAVEEAHGYARRALGVSDDGPIRYLALGGIGYALDEKESQSLVRGPAEPSTRAIAGTFEEVVFLERVMTFVRLVGELSSGAEYGGSWLFGLEMHGLLGYTSSRQRHNIQVTPSAYIPVIDGDDYLRTVRADARHLAEGQGQIVDRLLRGLLRSLDREETLLDRS